MFGSQELTKNYQDYKTAFFGFIECITMFWHFKNHIMEEWLSEGGRLKDVDINKKKIFRVNFFYKVTCTMSA